MGIVVEYQVSDRSEQRTKRWTHNNVVSRGGNKKRRQQRETDNKSVPIDSTINICERLER